MNEEDFAKSERFIYEFFVWINVLVMIFGSAFIVDVWITKHLHYTLSDWDIFLKSMFFPYYGFMSMLNYYYERGKRHGQQ